MINLTPLKIVLHFSSLFKVLKIGFFSITKCHAFTFAMTPNSPDGLNIKTRINSKKAYISLWLGEI